MAAGNEKLDGTAAAMPVQLASKRICVVGMCVTDLIYYVPRMPAPGETLVGSKFASGFGGKGANQAVQAALLGSDVVMVSTVGDDTFGRDTVQNFKRRRVDAEHVICRPGTTSGVAPIAVDTSTGQNSIVIVPGAADGFTPEDVEKAAAAISLCGVMVCQLEVPLETTVSALRLGHEKGLLTILNTAPAPPGIKLPQEIWGLCDIVCPNEPELEGLTGMPVGTEAEVEAAAREVIRRGAKRVLVTLGSRGSALFEPNSVGRFVPGVRAIAKDTSGAGDSFLGSLVHYMVEGFPLVKAMDYANRVAAVSITREGTQRSYPDADEVLARHAIGLIDHTSLGLDDTDEKIRKLVDTAVADSPHTAAVCIYPKFVSLVRGMQEDDPKKYPRSLRVCTVVNFPSGKESTQKVVADAAAAVKDGADEVDLVIDYNLLKEDVVKGKATAEALTRAVRKVCPEDRVLLKVIIESGELKDPALITAACEASIGGGCDFVKTSTGKVPVNATPEAAEVMLRAVASHTQSSGSSGRVVGFKAAGGVKDLAATRRFLEIAATALFGDANKWLEVDSRHMRFGASSLLGALRDPKPSNGTREQGY